MKGKTVIIGIDGIPFSMLESLAKRDVMPCFKRLMDDGVFTPMYSSTPAVSSISWSSIITGCNPGNHNIYGFTDLIPGSYSLRYPNFSSLKAKPFWTDGFGRCHVVNVPMTYPVSPLDGSIVSGFVSLDINRASYPSSFTRHLKDVDYEVDVDSSLVYKSEELFFKRLFEVHDKRIELFNHLWKTDWDTFMFVFTGSDRLGHFFWDAAIDSSHRWHDSFIEYFRKIDKVIEKIATSIGDMDTLLLLSDHGMTGIKHNVNLDVFLQDCSLQSVDGNGKSLNSLSAKSKVFSLDPGRFYINNSRFPRGCVSDFEFDNVVDSLVECLSGLHCNGNKVFKHIFRKHDVYKGMYVFNAPDVVTIPSDGFSLHSGLGKRELFEPAGRIVGMHTWEDAFLFVNGRENRDLVPLGPHVEDVVSILNKVGE